MTETSFNYHKTVPDILQALQAVHGAIDTHALDAKLKHLVLLRASQMNGCAFCVKMHTREALEDGESQDRLHRLIVWRHVDDFTPDEKAAFAWTEALTDLDTTRDLTALRAELKSHFSADQIGTLTTLIGMINLWNRIQGSTH